LAEIQQIATAVITNVIEPCGLKTSEMLNNINSRTQRIVSKYVTK